MKGVQEKWIVGKVGRRFAVEEFAKPRNACTDERLAARVPWWVVLNILDSLAGLGDSTFWYLCRVGVGLRLCIERKPRIAIEDLKGKDKGSRRVT